MINAFSISLNYKESGITIFCKYICKLLIIGWLFVDRAEKEKQTIVIEIEAMSSQLDTANKARVSCFFVLVKSNTIYVATALSAFV